MHPPLACPFNAADRALAAKPKDVKMVFVDLHAEVTSEKMGMGWYLDGRVSAVVGTHTHVPTADERILPQGTGHTPTSARDRLLPLGHRHGHRKIPHAPGAEAASALRCRRRPGTPVRRAARLRRKRPAAAGRSSASAWRKTRHADALRCYARCSSLFSFSPVMNYWLMKTEPDRFGLHHLKGQAETHRALGWRGHYQARNFLRAMKKNDLAFFLPSSTLRGARYCRDCENYARRLPDHTAWHPESEHFDPKSSPDNPIWYMVDVRLEREFKYPIPLTAIKAHPAPGNHAPRAARQPTVGNAGDGEGMEYDPEMEVA